MNYSDSELFSILADNTRKTRDLSLLSLYDEYYDEISNWDPYVVRVLFECSIGSGFFEHSKKIVTKFPDSINLEDTLYCILHIIYMSSYGMRYLNSKPSEQIAMIYWILSKQVYTLDNLNNLKKFNKFESMDKNKFWLSIIKARIVLRRGMKRRYLNICVRIIQRQAIHWLYRPDGPMGKKIIMNGSIMLENHGTS